MLLLTVLAFLIALGGANFARGRVAAALALGERIKGPGGRTAAQVARDFLDASEASDVRIVEHNALVTDYFDPRRRTLFLHRDVMNGVSIAAWAIALHEAAHATQSGEARAALDWRLTCIRATRYLPALIAALVVVLGFLKRLPWPIGIRLTALSWGVIMILNLLSLPVEFNASRRALAFLQRRLGRSPEDLEEIGRILSGLAWRDTAALIRSPLYCLFGALPVGGALRPR